MIENLERWLDDYILTPEGRYVTGLSLLFKESAFVREAQIEQNHPEAIVIRLVRQGEYCGENERRIRAEAQRRLGSAIRIHSEYVDRIPREPGGKFRFIKSRLPAPFYHANSLGNLIGVASDEASR